MASCEDVIKDAARFGHSILHLNYQKLTCLPDDLCQPPLARLIKKLYIKRNLLSNLPSQIGCLASLVELYLHSNFLESLPYEIGRLESLCDLNVGNNRLRSLPTSIGKLRNLKRLCVSHNKLVSLPDEIGALALLESLQAMSNQLSYLPSSIAECYSLLLLSVDHNRLTVLPDGIVALKDLVELSVSGNGLCYLPYDLDRLRNLSALVVDNNPRLSWIPATVFLLPNLTTISISRCNVASQQHTEDGLQKLIKKSLDCCIPSLLELAAKKLPEITKRYWEYETPISSIPLSLRSLLNPSGHCWRCGSPFYKEAFPIAYSESEVINKLALDSFRQQIKGTTVDFALMFCSWTCRHLHSLQS